MLVMETLLDAFSYQQVKWLKAFWDFFIHRYPPKGRTGYGKAMISERVMPFLLKHIVSVYEIISGYFSVE